MVKLEKLKLTLKMDANTLFQELTLDQRLKSLNISYFTLVILLSSIDMIGPFATDAHLSSLPKMTRDLDTSPSWIQFSVLSYSFILAISSLIGGYLSDKYGRRFTAIFGLIFFVIGGFGCTFTPNIIILNISRTIQGFGGGISSITSSTVARDVFLANERLKIMAVLSTLKPVTIALAPVFGGFISHISSLYSWRMVFFITSCIASLVLLITVLKLPETKKNEPQRKNTINNPNKSSMIRIVCNDCVLLTMSLITSFKMVCVFVYLIELPYVVDHIYGYNEIIAGGMIGSGALFVVIGAWTSICLTKKDTNKTVKTIVMQLRLAAICCLFSCAILVIGPILTHWDKIHNNENKIYLCDIYGNSNNNWYFIVVPFCILAFSEGLSGPSSKVIVLEPYPDIVGKISSILIFWRILLPTVVMIIITQIIGQRTNHFAELLIYFIMTVMTFSCFVLVFGGPCLWKKNVKIRMDRAKNTSKLLEPSVTAKSVNAVDVNE